jgi:hypothetical protein
MPKQEYPKWVFGPDGKSKIVADPDAHAALGPDWYEEPYDAKGNPPAPKPVEDLEAIWPGDLTQAAQALLVAKVEYPKWVFGPDGQAKIVQSEAQFEALGAGWFETPDEAKAGKANPPQVVAPTLTGASVAEQRSAPPATSTTGTPLNINALNVAEASLYIDTLTDLEQLAALAAAEEQGKNRKTVKDAVNARINVLISPPAAAPATPPAPAGK